MRNSRWISLAKAVCYTVAFVVLQLAGSFFAIALYCVVTALPTYTASGRLPAYDALMGAATDFAARYATELAALGDLLAILAVWVFFLMRGKRLRTETNARRVPARALWPAAIWGASLAFVVCAALALLPIPEAVLQSYAQASQSVLLSPGPLAFVSIVLIAPFAEEVFFRGLVYTRLRRSFSPRAAALLASALFALIHTDPLWMLYAFCMGMAMAFVFERCGTLWASIAFHVVFNFFGAYVQPLLGGMPAGYALALVAACVIASVYLPRHIQRLDKPPEEGLY